MNIKGNLDKIKDIQHKNSGSLKKKLFLNCNNGPYLYLLSKLQRK